MAHKCGKKTSEFWLASASTAAALVVVVVAIAFKWDLSATLLGTALSPALTYITGRSALKTINKQGDGEQ
ncbi:MAG: hypothetical protein KDA17_04440 [Candidatus Saccharibacteria bacterium]|nr:hypothetical protein [Candidatus Saccharibacteria bacterium]